MKYKFLLCSIAVVLIQSFATAQNTYPIKEYYDKLYPNYSPSNINYSDCGVVGNQLSWVLSSLLRMYQTTGDKAYLVKFVNHCIQIQKYRRDEVNSGDDPVWVRKTDDLCGTPQDNAEPAYFNSLLIYPMSEFVNMVINETGHTLYNTNLPIQPYISQDIVDMTTLNSMNPGFPVIGYGDFAYWLGKRVEETIIYINNNYWDDSFGIKNHFNDGQNGEGNIGTAMNMNSPYGSALLFMGLANANFGYGNNRADYLYKAQIIASFYKGIVNIVDGCSCNLSGCATYNHPVLRLMSNGNNSYFWFHAGWALFKEDCIFHIPPETNQPRVTDYIQFVEDVSHGAMDLWFVRACYEAQFAPCNTCTPYFTFTEMERFRNTLTKNIYYTDITGGHFHNTVEGLDYGFANNTCGSNCPPDLMWGEVLDWMPMYKFDGSSTPNAYDIILNHALGVIQTSSTQNLTGHQSFLGLSEVVKAQWDMECVNLTLYNRDVVYDQDFVVKNNLVVAPQQSDNNYQAGVDDPFAEPKTFTDNGSKDRFVVEPGTTVNFVAGESIVFGPGTHLKAGPGGVIRAYIDPNLCTDGMKMRHPNGGNGKTNNGLSSSIPIDTSTKIIGQEINNEDKAVPALAEGEIKDFSIYPNPSNGLVYISFSTTGNSTISIVITDLLGQTIFNEINNQKIIQGNYIISFDGSTQTKGVYICNLYLNGQLYSTDKIVLVK